MLDTKTTFKVVFYFLKVSLKNNMMNESTNMIALAIIIGRTPFTDE